MNIFRHVSAICQGNGLQEIISLFGFRNENTKTVKPTFYFWNRPSVFNLEIRLQTNFR